MWNAGRYAKFSLQSPQRRLRYADMHGACTGRTWGRQPLVDYKRHPLREQNADRQRVRKSEPHAENELHDAEENSRINLAGFRARSNCRVARKIKHGKQRTATQEMNRNVAV